ncbi:hypothetical protein MRX96_041373 [Rhipicephalus microplus]
MSEARLESEVELTSLSSAACAALIKPNAICSLQVVPVEGKQLVCPVYTTHTLVVDFHKAGSLDINEGFLLSVIPPTRPHKVHTVLV